jgi:serine/threonine protein kinase
MPRTGLFDASRLADVRERFKREAQAAGRRSHPHIVPIHDYGEESGTPYIVMELIAGQELAGPTAGARGLANYRETLTRRNVAGITVCSPPPLRFSRSNSSTSAACSSAALPFFAAAS